MTSEPAAWPSWSRRGLRRACAAVAAAALGAAAALVGYATVEAAEPSAVGPGAVSPTQWPSSQLSAPQIEGWPNALRIWGPDRYQTSLAAALVGRGKGGFPFDSPDATAGNGPALADGSGWWGLGACPRAIILVAGDSPADALAAASLSDPTGRSSEPFMRRVAAADPLFDPPGGFARVDTHAAPILLTPSARSGARTLALQTRIAARDLRSGGCKTARQAIIVGGPAAVPVEAESELVSLGYAEVFRVSGPNRYGTAAAVASSLGTVGPPDDAAGCAAASSSDGPPELAYWGNSVVEWRRGPSECRLLGRTVVLADGIDGVDAMAAGWWTSFWQVPVLLHDGSDRLPAETAAELSLLGIDNIIVLGGERRIPPQVVDQATRFAKADAIRISGADRFDTSVEMARQLGGWWPGVTDQHFGAELLCVAASSRSSRRGQGWPDALMAGAWCGVASAVDPAPPGRMLAPVTIDRPAQVGVGSQAARTAAGAAVPLLLVPAGGGQLPASVRQFLSEAFSVPQACTAQVGAGGGGDARREAVAYASALARGSCPQPGFAVAFGGPATVSAAALGEISSLLSGGLTSASEPSVVLVGAETPDRSARLGVSSVPGVALGLGAYATELSMAPVFAEPARSGERRDASRQVCLPRATYAHARWLITEAAANSPPLTVVEVPATSWYRQDASGVRRAPGVGTPACIDAPAPADGPLLARAVDPSGRSSQSLLLVADASRRFAVDGAVRAQRPEASGAPSRRPLTRDGLTRWRFETEAPAVDAILDGTSSAITSTRLTLALRHRAPATGETGDYPRPATFNATWTVRTARGSVTGAAKGEAVFSSGQWHLRGASVLEGGSWTSAELGPPPRTPEVTTGPDASAPTQTALDPLRVGTLDAYGAGGFSATVTVNGQSNADDTIIWQPEAYINTKPNTR